jgi:hypothetical protein
MNESIWIPAILVFVAAVSATWFWPSYRRSSGTGGADGPWPGGSSPFSRAKPEDQGRPRSCEGG